MEIAFFFMRLEGILQRISGDQKRYLPDVVMMHKDPICGMDVQEEKAIKLESGGQSFYFCSEYCKKTFLDQKSKKSTPVETKADGKTIYTCPMHPEIRQDHPGDCPKCGMHLEPLSPSGDDSEDQKVIHSLSRKFWIGLGLQSRLSC